MPKWRPPPRPSSSASRHILQPLITISWPEQSPAQTVASLQLLRSRWTPLGETKWRKLFPKTCDNVAAEYRKEHSWWPGDHRQWSSGQWRSARCCQVVARCDNVPGWTLDIFLLKLSQDRKQGADCGLLAREFLEQFLSTVPAVSRHIRWLVAVTMQSPTHTSHQQSLAMLPASISSAQRTVWGCGTYSFLQFPASAAGWRALTLGRVTELSFTAGSWQICRAQTSVASTQTGPSTEWQCYDSSLHSENTETYWLLPFALYASLPASEYFPLAGLWMGGTVDVGRC